MSISLF